jgi:large subunit ribosomal protein L32e
MKKEELLRMRNEKNTRKPEFLRQDAHKKVKLEKKWRQPKGMHSKMRLKLRGYKKQPSMGYGSPKLVRGLDRKGNEMIIVNSIKDLDGVKTPITISSHVGLKKKIEILKVCIEKKIEVLNVKDSASFIKSVEENMKKKKEDSKKKEEKKKKSKEAAEKKAAEKKAKEENVEEKEAREKEEKRKVMEGKS